MRAWVLCLLLWVVAHPVWAQDFRALAVPDSAASRIEDGWRGRLSLDLAISQPVPWRVFLRDDPWRLIIDTSEVDWARLDPSVIEGEQATALHAGRVHLGWSRLVVDLAGPMRIDRAWMETGPTPRIRIDARPGIEGEASPTGPLITQAWDQATPQAVAPTPRRHLGDRPLVVALDPGHGGIDPGAERAGVTEAGLMLAFARELAEMLRRAGHDVVLTRTDDYFVALRGRASIARDAGADLMISLHADAIDGGGAQGATVYTLSDDASDAMSAELAARHSRDDLLLGLDLEDQGDEVARVLIDLARAETEPRSDALADALVASIRENGIRLHKRPRLEAAFTVLKAPDIPSVLVEVGFMSDQQDLLNLTTPAWRTRMASAILAAVDAWAIEDAAAALRLRQ
ncbi:N-acetylmuramoyl-L-alanine amidase [Jannaschia pagri]|uniref:N-acetylmuramoyl-L-alanine amidase n=1 Tax=Jannaschia pagri TaxID=2829797 RepID=A0ABQ4NPI3_9RHOB|nr:MULTISPECIES: N-acetylmuramoyl-L-alanine amidase [unclassified Jannaschia]GIT92453.1 N-acetylmuramoyl-L-alanine amidase [Jannaschia sp. AI_61]GIT96288.1 N-acetylmuramoyl-L-alanine amidase [Jannaschia sp. AI_62]